MQEYFLIPITSDSKISIYNAVIYQLMLLKKNLSFIAFPSFLLLVFFILTLFPLYSCSKILVFGIFGFPWQREYIILPRFGDILLVVPSELCFVLEEDATVLLRIPVLPALSPLRLLNRFARKLNTLL